MSNEKRRPTHRLTLCLDNGRQADATFQDVAVLWPSDKKPGQMSGRLSLVGDFTLRAGSSLSVLIQPIGRDVEAPASGDGDPTKGW